MDYLIINYDEMQEFVKEQIELTINRTLRSAKDEAISNIDDLFDKKGLKVKLEKGILK